MMRGLSLLTALFRASRPRPIVLMYHRIADADCDPWGLAVSPACFDNQLAMLKRERTVMPLRAFGSLLADRRLPDRAVAITFDDGYACNALVAAPLLRRHGLPATFFLASGAIGGEREFWWDELERLLVWTKVSARVSIEIGTKRFCIDFDAPPVPRDALKSWYWSDASPYPRQRLYMEVWTEMRLLSQGRQRSVLDALWRESTGTPNVRESHRVMTETELTTLAADLFETAPHTVTHPALGALPAEAQRQEIVDSAVACARLSAAAAPLFAYPYGDATATTRRIVRDVGFALACTTDARAVGPNADPFAIPRFQVRDQSPARVKRGMDSLMPCRA